ncbi:MAG: aldehyde dehydrogenase family protein, partial [Proteobacteria bacterium]|nr:aldehyde dehydrogenase family protein [Pseudomonadota bacterium]
MALFEEVPSESGHRRYNIKSPVNLESIGEFEAASAAEVKAAVDRARKAQREWASSGVLGHPRASSGILGHPRAS